MMMITPAALITTMKMTKTTPKSMTTCRAVAVAQSYPGPAEGKLVGAGYGEGTGDEA